MDDIIVIGNDNVEMDKIKKRLATDFEMKDLGQLRYFFGMEIARIKRGISISQRKYVLDCLKETSMMGSKSIDTPMDPKTKLEDNKDD